MKKLIERLSQEEKEAALCYLEKKVEVAKEMVSKEEPNSKLFLAVAEDELELFKSLK